MQQDGNINEHAHNSRPNQQTDNTLYYEQLRAIHDREESEVTL
jgi:hypothetical protein